MNKSQRVLIFAEQASLRSAGEAGLALHYYRVLRKQGVPVWLVCHARARAELPVDKAHPGPRQVRQGLNVFGVARR